MLSLISVLQVSQFSFQVTKNIPTNFKKQAKRGGKSSKVKAARVHGCSSGHLVGIVSKIK